MKPKARVILERAVEEGVRYGWMRAHKYAENPSDAEVQSTLESAVMSAIYEVFDFEDENATT